MEKQKCWFCKGTGKQICYQCKGNTTYKRLNPIYIPILGCSLPEIVTCETCRGTGKINCPYCHGTGERQ